MHTQLGQGIRERIGQLEPRRRSQEGASDRDRERCCCVLTLWVHCAAGGCNEQATLALDAKAFFAARRGGRLEQRKAARLCKVDPARLDAPSQAAKRVIRAG